MMKSNRNHKLKAEFDSLADEYYEQHKANIAITGEAPEYFSEYKIADLHKFIKQSPTSIKDIFDFGCGIGNSVPFFKKYFDQSHLHFGDVSSRSLEIASSRFNDIGDFIQIEDTIPLPSGSQDLVFSACVFHHIPPEDHHRWLMELNRITKPGGILAIYEHNPLNPLTLRAVNTCALDVNAQLIKGSELRNRVLRSGWKLPRVDYKLFFPSFLKAMRPLETHLEWLCLGAQYRLIAYKSL